MGCDSIGSFIVALLPWPVLQLGLVTGDFGAAYDHVVHFVGAVS